MNNLALENNMNSMGFTLLELLVVIVIIGILAATAIVQYSQYKSRSFDSRAISDIRNIMSAQEAYFADHETYVAEIGQLSGFDSESPSVTVLLAADDESWSGSSYHPAGGNTYCYNSGNQDGIVVVPGLNQSCP